MDLVAAAGIRRERSGERKQQQSECEDTSKSDHYSYLLAEQKLGIMLGGPKAEIHNIVR